MANMNHTANEGSARRPDDLVVKPRKCTGMGIHGENTSHRILSGKLIVWDSNRSTRSEVLLFALGAPAAVIALLYLIA